MVTVLTTSLAVRPDALAVAAIIGAIRTGSDPGTTLTMEVIVSMATPVHTLTVTMSVTGTMRMPMAVAIPGMMDPHPFNRVVIHMATTARGDRQACRCAKQPANLCTIPSAYVFTDGSTNHGAKNCAGNPFDIPVPGIGCTGADQCNSRHRQGCQVAAKR
jgi:hypothetical protein